jgi:DNA mismatch repair protein MutS
MYVPNDVELGCGLAKDGLLIFGTNMIGKTSLIRAVGIAVFIAQCGFYVPCSSMRYWPYRSIMTRIVCNDNLFKGISTFAMEMIELRIILRDADKRTLVLGDELGASTEHKSAFSIFVATLMQLSRAECTFLFTTHFYEILKMDELDKLARLALCHLEVSYDGEKLVYNRKLMDGAGLANYGLECCKSMYFGVEFMETAYKLRNKYYPELAGVLNWEKSAYNAGKLKGVCEKCGEKMGEEIHHKVPQADANKSGFLMGHGGIHKNVVANLMSLCEKCHLKEHSTHPL